MGWQISGAVQFGQEDDAVVRQFETKKREVSVKTYGRAAPPVSDIHVYATDINFISENIDSHEIDIK